MIVNLQHRKCLVVGAGKVAAGKIEGLLVHGAEVTVVSPRAVRAIEKHAQAGELVWRQREFSPRDVAGAFLAVAATGSAEVNAAVFRSCSRRGVLCNSVDDPAHCDFYYPAVVRRGPLQIAISTGGGSPALAGRLRRELEQQFGPEWAAWVEQLGKQREELQGRKISAAARKRILVEAAGAEAFKAFTAGLERKAAAPGKRRPK
jgi:precorrin-2 dehydrogenase/sirohydrochlorin ferrochelatase